MNTVEYESTLLHIQPWADSFKCSTAFYKIREFLRSLTLPEIGYKKRKGIHIFTKSLGLIF